jgi:predicted pyridoxine 5'-phosphate oxidase superfamily flavin-nucleotide-binding protein
MLDVYHAGEIAVQERTGERSLAERRASIIGNRLADGARDFLSQQGVVAVAVEAPDGSLWASLWCGAPGFLRADESGEQVEVKTEPLRDDIVHQLVRSGNPLGMVVIDFATRRRLRINGVVRSVDSAGFVLRVRETFGNCVKYIQRRWRSDQPERGGGSAIVSGRTLDDERRGFIARTDTLFVASIHAERGLDVSHRGGEPGFVRVVDDVTLGIPDYSGNSMYQTLGNFAVDARAGLALIDFDGRRVLSLTGTAAVVFGSDDPHHATGGTGRYWSFSVDRWMEHSLPATVTWTLVDRSPFNPASAT